MAIPAAPFGHRLMLGRSLLDGGTDAAVAAETDAVAGGAQQPRLVAGVGDMAIVATTGPNRTMHPAGCADFTMTGATERTLIGNEQMGLGGTVRRMASKTTAFGYRRMGMGLTGGNGWMTGLTEPGAGFFQGKSGGGTGMGSAGRLMANQTIAGSNGGMGNRRRSESSMTGRGHTALVGACGISPAQRPQQEETTENNQQPMDQQQTPSQAKVQLDGMLSRR